MDHGRCIYLCDVMSESQPTLIAYKMCYFQTLKPYDIPCERLGNQFSKIQDHAF